MPWNRCKEDGPGGKRTTLFLVCFLRIMRNYNITQRVRVFYGRYQERVLCIRQAVCIVELTCYVLFPFNATASDLFLSHFFLFIFLLWCLGGAISRLSRSALLLCRAVTYEMV